MKKIILYLLVAAVFAGCSESFLDTTPLTQKTDENYYLTPQDAEQALVGAYSVLPTIPPWTNSFLSAELMSDDRFGGGGDNDRVAHAIDGFTTDGTADMFRDAWAAYYRGIFRCNMLLDNINKPKWENDDQKGSVEGQARFLRAYYYFDLAKMFGTVPLIIEAKPINNPKAPAADIFAQIATDLKIAIENFPSITAQEADPKDLGRATKWAAEGLMARVFLFYTGYYQTTNLPLVDGGTVEKSDVIGWLEDCVNNSGHDLLPDFRSLWPYSLVTDANSEKTYKYAVDNDLSWTEDAQNHETVFAVKYSNSASWGTSIYYSNQIDLFFGVRGQSDYNNVFPFGQGWGFGPVNSDMWDNWPSGDLRKEASICNVANANEGIVTYNPNGDKNMHETQMWQKKYVPVNIVTNSSLHNYCVDYYNRAADYQLNNMQDLVLLRFADVLLMHSELTETIDGINRVRARAGLTPIASYSVDALREERRYELAFEGIRYYDLLRYGLDYAKTAIGRGEGVLVTNSGVPASMHYNLGRIDETGGFLQIPNAEILLSNGVLEQNPGW
ncbi:MAG: RagB/SusD family nutrient uptake outer membrane protein [Bacteroidales bacterium]